MNATTTTGQRHRSQGRGRSRRAIGIAALAALGLVSAGCASDGGEETTAAEAPAAVPDAPAGSVGGTATTVEPTVPPSVVDDSPAPSSSSSPSSPLPALEVVDVRSGSMVSLADVAPGGRPTLLWFWAPHCSVCRAEAPELEAFATGSVEDVTVVGLGAKDDLALGQDFIAATGVTFPMVWDDAGTMWREYGITSQPAAVLLDAQGDQVERWQGRVDPDDVATALAGLA